MHPAVNSPAAQSAIERFLQSVSGSGQMAVGLVLGALLFWAGTRRHRHAGRTAAPATDRRRTPADASVRGDLPKAADASNGADLLARAPLATVADPTLGDAESHMRISAQATPLPQPIFSDLPPSSVSKITRLYGAGPGASDTGRRLDSFGPYGRDVDDDRPGESDSHVVVCYEEEAEEEELTSPLARILVSAKGESDPGRKRRLNHDSLLFVPEFSLYAVADGMGEAAGGQVASSLAVEALRQAFERESFVGDLRSETPIPRRGRELASSILQANWAVFEAARSNPALNHIGTTLVTARFSPNKQRLYIGHVGDSRCYRLRAGTLRQLTTDQTVGALGQQGPRAKDLLQAIGVTADLSIDLIVDKPRSDDLYLLCSDGLPKMASDREIQRVLTEEPDLEAAVRSLIDLANEHGGTDNVTVILVKVLERAFKPALTVPPAEVRLKPSGYAPGPRAGERTAEAGAMQAESLPRRGRDGAA